MTIRYVKDGQVIFTEGDNGELSFVDKEMERSFTEKMSEVQADEQTVEEMAEDVASGLQALKLLTAEEKRALREKFKRLQAKLHAIDGK